MLSEQLTDGADAVPAFKAAITQTRAELDKRFYAGEDIEPLIADRATLTDHILAIAWQRFEWKENLTSWHKTRIALVAVGGYGRGELHPHSDIDLLILLERNNYHLHEDSIQRFLTLLWDFGLEVGHSVRSISECRVQAEKDVSVVTSLMETRTIAGDDELRARMMATTGPNKIWPARKFFLAKQIEQNERHEKFEHTESSLEPNVKTSPGGLRDFQTVLWIARRSFGTDNFAYLVDNDFLTQPEIEQLVSCRRFLWKVRYALHLVARREDDRLLFEYQRELAKLFSYGDDAQLAVEHFMQDYYRAAIDMSATNELLLQHFEETIVRAGERVRIRPINDRFQIHNDFLEVASEAVFVNYPPALLEMFVLVGTQDDVKGVRASTIRLAKKHASLIDESFRHDPRATELFMTLLRDAKLLYTQLRSMARYGILSAYLPEFGRIIGQMQFDLFHIYTVDAHTLQVVRNMRRFRHRNQEQQFPIAAHIHPRLRKTELLYIAGLYHDIAKGMGGDHSKLGVEIAREFCNRHRLGTWETNLVCWLVEHHLIMSTTSQRKDISDPEVIHDFALFVGDEIRLNYLYALTVADINATNPTLWNSWRASLMRKLYNETRKALRHGLEKPVDHSEYVTENRETARVRLLEKGLSDGQITEIWEAAEDDYFQRESVADITWQTESIYHHDTDGPLVLVHDYQSRRSDEGATQIFIHTRNSRMLFAATTRAMETLGLNIVDARITSSVSQLVFDTYIVLESGQPVGHDPERIEQIRSTLIDVLQRRTSNRLTERRTPRTLREFTFKTDVTISNDPATSFTTVEIVTPDRTGLLAIIANTFAELGVRVHSAKITTLGERVEDLFYIVDGAGTQIVFADFQREIADRLATALDDHVSETS